MSTQATIPCLESQGLHIPSGGVVKAIVYQCNLCKGKITKSTGPVTILHDECTCEPHFKGAEDKLHAWIVDDGGTMAIWNETRL